MTTLTLNGTQVLAIGYHPDRPRDAPDRLRTPEFVHGHQHAPAPIDAVPLPARDAIDEIGIGHGHMQSGQHAHGHQHERDGVRGEQGKDGGKVGGHVLSISFE